MRSRAPFAFGAVGFWLLAVAAGCSLITSYDGFTGGVAADAIADAARADGMMASTGADALVDGGDAASTAVCFTEIPPPPSGQDDGKSSMPIFSVTSQLYVVDENDDSNICTLGLDINGGRDCNVDSGTPACTTIGARCSQGDNHDDTAKSALYALSASFPDSFGTVLTDALAAHQVGLLIGVANYNGLLDDSRTDVVLYNTVGGSDDGGILVDVANQIPYESVTAYVTNGVLVADFGGAPMTVRLVVNRNGTDAGTSYFQTVINDPRLVASITVDATGTGLTLTNGQLTGRIRVQDFVTTLAEIDGCNFGSLACAYLDVPTTRADDGKGEKCTATTFSLGFQSVPATKGAAGPGITPTNFCDQDDASAGDPDADPCP